MDDSFPVQPKKVYDGLTSATSKNYILFTEDEGAEEHCHVVHLLSQIKEYSIG
jgi:hypothetical protein